MRAVLLRATLAVLLAVGASADVRLGTPFGDRMVLQRDRALSVWGTADPGESLSVVFATHVVSTRADLLGRWSVELPPLDASARPRPLQVHGAGGTLRVEDVLVGDVWICSGQSNMRFALARSTAGAEAAATATDAGLRWLDLAPRAAPDAGAFTAEELTLCNPRDYLGGGWSVAGPETAARFSAVAYHFGRALRDVLGVPVGLVLNAVGGSPTEAWIRPELAASAFGFGTGVGSWLDDTKLHPWCRERASENLAGWMDEVLAAADRGELPPPTPGHPFRPGFLYEAGIAPLVGLRPRGVLWYQGESNGHDPALMRALTGTLIADWRGRFDDPELPFGLVQLPGMGTAGGYPAELWPDVREAQRTLAAELDGVGLVVTIDLGARDDVHPRAKREVGERLARWALAEVYGHRSRAPAGPLYYAHLRGEGVVRLFFQHAADGLRAGGGGELRGFEIAGADGRFLAAQARISGPDTLVVESPDVRDPRWVRYAWAPFPDGNLTSGEGLPAAPFTTEELF
ncbi:MAG: sialate O-acetylesterase [Planctomycetota bacterium]